MEVITPSFLNGKNVLFVADKVWSVSREDDFIEEGSVIGILEERREVLVCFLYEGYKSTTQNVPFGNILSVEDTKNGAWLTLGVFKGRGHDLRGIPPFGLHPLAVTR